MVKTHTNTGDMVQSGQQSQDRRLSRARRTKEGGDFPVRKVDIDVELETAFPFYFGLD